MIKKHTQQLRMIGGTWRSRYIHFVDTPNIRPTPHRVRETLFNWLAPVIESSVCLDLFAGSGALSFEAVSRGAKHATLIDKDSNICTQIQNQIDFFSAKKQMGLHCMSAQKYLQQVTQPYTLIFLDPPFHHDHINPILQTLSQHPAVYPGSTLIYLEYQSQEQINIPEPWHMLRQSSASTVSFCLLATAPQQKL